MTAVKPTYSPAKPEDSYGFGTVRLRETTLGGGIAVAGDVNGDGVADVAIVATGYDGAAGSECGKVYVYSGVTVGSRRTDTALQE